MADYNIPIAGGAGVATDRPTDNSVDAEGEGYFDVARLRRQYYDYLGSKMAEIEEQKEARRYYHGAQWTDKEIKALKRRRQPVVTSNRISRKIDAITGLIERLRQDPKAFPRTPDAGDGADVATATLRYVLDHADWKSKSPRVARYAAIDGLCGIEIDLEQGDQGDPDLNLHIVYPDTFFYDPRSIDDGFTDARFMGVSKWMDVDQAKELFPDKEDEIDGLVESGSDLTPNSDRELTWVNTSAKKVRLIDHWYVFKGRWCWASYIGNVILMEGVSPYIDERNKTFPKYIMFSAAVDHDGDRYGPIRNLKGPQDEVNHRRSKALHILNSRRVISEKGAVDDVEKARSEWAKPDGWIEINPNKKMEPENQQADFSGQLEMLQEAKTEIENFGPNPALIGQGIENSSGRAISLLQQAGVAELGPYIIAYRTWKIRVYRAIWNTIQRYWTAERWIRVTDDDGLAQFIQLNGVGLDDQGHPALVNAVGSLDVDVILDEGPDNINMMADAYDSLLALAQQGSKIPPEVLIELAPLQNDVKRRLLDKMKEAQQQDPAKMAAQQVALQSEAAKTEQSKSVTAKNYADAMVALHGAHLDNEQARFDARTALESGQPGAALMASPQPAESAPAASPPGTAGALGPAQAPAPPPAEMAAPAAPAAPLAPAGAAQPPVMIHFDANREAMDPLMQGMQQHQDMLGAAIQSMAQTAQSMQAIAQALTADTELVRDQTTGRAIGARKVLRLVSNGQ